MNCFYASLEQEALLHISGPDALSFLQGQVTCDTRKLGTTAALPGIYCTVQGRVVCDFLLCQDGADHFLLRLRRDIREASAALFAKYIVFSKARLEAQRDDWDVLACWGPDANATLRQVFGVSLPLEKYGASSGEGFILVQLDDAGQQFECYLNQAASKDLRQAMTSVAQSAEESVWRALQVASGVARIEARTAGEFVPQMLNYDVTGHISFNKGCYTGQEVVARLHYRGKAKRRLYAAEFSKNQYPDRAVPAPGAPLYSAGGTQAAGSVVNTATAADGRLLMLVTATADGFSGGLSLAGEDSPALIPAALPYTIPAK